MAAIIAATTAIFVFAPAKSAQALITIDVGLGLNVTAPYIEGPLTGETQPLDTVGNLVCEPGQTVGGYLPSGEPVSQALCAIPALDYQFVTRFKKSRGGQIVRRHTALVNVPTALNVDEDVSPDVLATLQMLSLSEFSLRIDRMLTEVSELPLKIEAIVDDPTAGALPREKINVGYDARDSGTPSLWKATATLPDDGSDALTTLNIAKDVTGAGATIATVGGLFNGDSLKRKNPMGGAITYTPVPPRATLGLTLGSHIEVRAGASIPVNVRASAEIVNGPREQRISANVAALPQQLLVRLEEPGADQRIVTHASSAKVPSLDATYTDTVDGTLATKVVAKATGVPTGMVLNQTGARKATFTATGGTLGSVEVGYANGEPRLLNVAHPYARVVEDGALKSYAGRVDDLMSASVDASDDIHAELQLGAGPRKRYRALVETPAAGGGRRVIDGAVSNLPRHLDIKYEAAEGLVTYDAFGETITEITLDAEQPAPFFGRVSRIHGAIGGLPPAATVDLKPDDADVGAAFTATPAIGRIDVGLSDGRPYPVLADGHSGAILRDTPQEFALAGRLQQVRGASFRTRGSQMVATLQTDPIAGADRQDVDVDVTYEDPDAAPDAVSGPTRISGTVVDLPSSVTITRAADHVRYDASEIVPTVTLTARGLPGGSPGGSLEGEIHDVDATLTGVPKSLRIVTRGAGKGIEALEGKIDRVDADLWDTGGASATPPEDDRNKLRLFTRDGRMLVQARAFDVTKALLVKEGETTKVTTGFGATPKGLDVQVQSGTATEPVALDLDLGDLPSSSEFTLNKDDGIRTTWHASQGGTDMHLGLSAKDIGADLQIRDLPANINHLCVGHNLDCDPQSPQEVVIPMFSNPIDDDQNDETPPVFEMDEVPYPFDNNVIVESDADGPLTVANGRVCLPPSDNPLPGPVPGQDAGRTGDVYDACIDGTAPNYVDLHEVSLKTARLEFTKQHVVIHQPDYPIYDEKLIKIWLATDDYGIRAGRAVIRNEDTSSEVVIETGSSSLRNTGDHFYALKNIGIPPNPLPDEQENQIASCDDLTVEVEVAGINIDVLPQPGELILGDVCA